MAEVELLRGQDSNLDSQNQNLVSYRLNDPGISWSCWCYGPKNID